jgi:putative ABC transport system permease protein
MTCPPRLAAWLLTMRLPASWRDFVLGDLEEEFQARAAVSSASARRWYWRQALRCLLAPPPDGRNTPDSSPPQGDSMIRSLAADLRYAIRVLSRTPSFALAVVAVFALGIGANTAIFGIVNGVLLRPLPFEQPDRLVRLFHVPPQEAFPGMPTFSVSAANYYDWKRSAQSFERMAIYRFRQFTYTGGGTAEAILAGGVGEDFFEITRAAPLVGRVFRPEENSPGGSHVVLLSEAFWKSHLGGRSDVVGRTLTLNGEAFEIVGVMPAWFSLESWGVTAQPIWVPLAHTDADRAVRENHNAQVIARLKPNVDVAEARAEMDLISSRLEREYPAENAGWGATVIPLHELIVGDVRGSLLMLVTAVGLVLLIACANVGNLLFTRALARRKELAIRSALGAGRARVFQQLVMEALVLASLGGAAGLVLARVGLGAGGALLSGQVPRADEISVDARVLLFVCAVSLLTGILAGALPAWRAGRTDVNDALKEGGRSDGSGVGIRTRRLLIVCEVALSLVLLMGAGVMARSFVSLRNVDIGVDSHNVLAMRLSLPDARFRTAAQKSAFFDAVLERLRALPGVESAGAVDDLPVTGGSVQPIVLEGHAELLPRDQPTVEVREVTPGYFRTMRIPIVAGRDVADPDVEVMLVSRAAAKLLWGDASPIGQRVTLPLMSRTLTRQVIGIVGDVKQGSLTEAAAPTVYHYTRERAWPTLALVMRTTVPPLTLAQPASAVVRAIDPEQPVEEMRTLDNVIDRTLRSRRFSTLVLGLFAAMALVLATLGIYSVLSYIVRGRSREIGIRTALGARTGDVLRLVVVEGMTPALIGIAAGVAGALAAARLLSTLVFGISASDPLTLAAVAGTLALVALAASLIPAWRASKLDPLTVLRS